MRTLLTLLLLTGPLAAQDLALGAEIFERHCATCHGIAGKGDGPMSAILLIKPPDLTGLSARNEGTFPMQRVVARIDGRDPLVAHGSPMPVYGDFFEGVEGVLLKAETGQPIMTSQPIADLVAFLETLQE